MKVYQKLAGSFNAMLNCQKNNNDSWEQIHHDIIENVTDTFLPSGSGIDSGNNFDFQNSKNERLIINSAFHKMDQNGFYDGWINYKVIIKPSLQFNFTLSIIGNFGRRQEIKEYLYNIYSEALEQEAGKTE
jgi:methionine synthase I (cobalamin-dependent)